MQYLLNVDNKVYKIKIYINLIEYIINELEKRDIKNVVLIYYQLLICSFIGNLIRVGMLFFLLKKILLGLD